jgi:hypothetical protein
MYVHIVRGCGVIAGGNHHWAKVDAANYAYYKHPHDHVHGASCALMRQQAMLPRVSKQL